MSSEKKPAARKRTADGATRAPRVARTRASNPETVARSAPTHQDIARRAYEIYLSDGRSGHELEHWLQAERELTQRF